MKKQSLLILILLFALGIKAQNCNFTYSFNAGATNVVTFTGNQNFPASHFAWDYGDGTVDTGFTTIHAFNSLPPFRVCCRILDSVNNITCISCDSIVGPNQVSCFFTGTQGSGLDFTFNAPNSQGYYVSWSLDGGLSWVAGNPFTHVFQQPGTYTVCVIKTDSLRGDTLCSSCSNFVVTGQTNNCSFIASNSPVSNFTYDFTSISNGFATLVNWSFGDGTSSWGPQVSHTFQDTGIYTVCMTTIDSLTFDSCYYCQHVVVSNVISNNCFFTYRLDTMPYSYIFNDSPAYPGSTISWDFGDNVSATGTNVNHTYASPGTYVVCINERDSVGNLQCTFCTQIVVGNSGNCSFTSTLNPLNNLTIDFQANSGLFSTVTWDFGDSSSIDTGLFASHTYAAPGNYTVCITVVTPGAVTCNYCSNVTVTGNTNTCAASFIATSLGLTGYFIDLSALSPNTVNSYFWDYGDQSTSTNRFSQHTYSSSGTYNVCLTVASGNCTDTYCSPITVDSTIINPTACRAFYAIVQLSPFQVTVVNLSSGVNLNFNWDFGDGANDSQPFPSHVYSSTGVYNLCLTVSDGAGCSDTFCDTLAVDSLGNIFRTMSAGFALNVVSPSQLTGVNEIIANKDFSVYPNPVSSELYLSMTNGSVKAKSYRMLSLIGTEVLKGNLEGVNSTISMKDLSNGIYLLEITTVGGTRGYQRIIKN
jgi:PKD repeat protein